MSDATRTPTYAGLRTWPHLLGVEEVAAVLDTSPGWVRAQAYRRALPAIKAGKAWKFDPSRLADALAAKTATPTRAKGRA